MPPQHARAGITHHGFDLFTPGRLIAMDRAFGADGFLDPKPAALQPDGGIIQKFPALRAKRRPGRVMVPAITLDHRHERLPFPGQSLIGKARAGCPAFFRRWPQARGFSGFHAVHC
jgi:hypothetical protein